MLQGRCVQVTGESHNFSSLWLFHRKNNFGVILFSWNSALLKLLNIEKDGSLDIELTSDGLLLKPVSVKDVYKKVSKKYRKSLDKLGE